MQEIVYSGTITVLNKLPYDIDINNKSWIKEEDIIRCMCQDNDVFYMQYFMGKTYLNLQNHNGTFPLLQVLIAIHAVYEEIADLKEKNEQEAAYESLVFPFIIQLAKIGAKEMEGNRPPLYVMEEMLLNPN